MCVYMEIKAATMHEMPHAPQLDGHTARVQQWRVRWRRMPCGRAHG